MKNNNLEITNDNTKIYKVYSFKKYTFFYIMVKAARSIIYINHFLYFYLFTLNKFFNIEKKKYTLTYTYTKIYTHEQVCTLIYIIYITHV
jgi:hypothetical protein